MAHTLATMRSIIVAFLFHLTWVRWRPSYPLPCLQRCHTIPHIIQTFTLHVSFAPCRIIFFTTLSFIIMFLQVRNR
ncbi:hypothetical protein F4811DRAFT_524221 [Daldinia bambusicola]|nr:hypothetical protein F4811DRAFT_524221 [Daldinia bambusicola]